MTKIINLIKNALAKPISLYIHVPFCAAKCAYCDFYSVALSSSTPDGLAKSELEINSWLDALELEAEFWREQAGAKLKLKTLYIGGGTPSLLNLSAWRRLIKIIYDLCDLKNLQEATSEANPSSLIVNQDLINFWRDNFFTRISLGVQSLNNDELKILGRLHDSTTALKALELINNSGLSSSADLIFGVPNQNLRSWSASLKGILDAGVNHISTYQLTLEENTPLGKIYLNSDLNSDKKLPDGYFFYRYAQWLLPKKNFLQYEISNFALNGHECRHNIAYWKQENVLALGPAASGYLDGVRYKNPENLEFYFQAAQDNFNNMFQDYENLNQNNRAVEAAILALRTRDGINKSEFIFKHGENLFNKVKNILADLPEHLIYISDEKLALTPAGMRVGNAVWTELMDLMEYGK